MKKSVVTRYETSDGRSFDSEMRAREHEISLAFANMSDEETRLTAAEAIRLMAAHPKDIIKVLKAISE